MRKILYFILFSLALFLGNSTIQSSYAAYEGIYGDSNTNIELPCSNPEDCNIEQSIKVAEEVTGGIVTDSNDVELSTYIVTLVKEFLKYTTLVAVLYVLYAGFRIMTSNGEENTVKSSQKGIIYVLVGIVVMWLAYAIVMLVMSALTNSRSTVYIDNEKPLFTWNLIPTTHAQNSDIYSESERGTFNEYKSKIFSKLEDISDELAIDKRVNIFTFNELKDLIEEAHKRLPDKNPKDMEINKRNKKFAFQKIEIAKQQTSSPTKVRDAISATSKFLNDAKISKISGSIEATPTSGNAPLPVSFNTNNVIDPTGTTPGTNNYTWWMRNTDGTRKDLGRGPSFLYTFKKEGTHTIFLDIQSSSKNNYGYTDVLPITLQKKIEVKPKLGEIVLFINDINVSNKSAIKITPEIASRGLFFNASASRAVSNGTIVKTIWDFGNGNKEISKTRPGVEMQTYPNEGKYLVSLKFTTNNGKTFSKEIQLDIRSPAAVIKTSKKQILVGEEATFSVDSFFNKNTKNIKYKWSIQGEDMKEISRMGENISYAFKKPGKYVVKLDAKNPNGKIDADSRIITVESRDPIVNIDTPHPIDNGHPNTLVFDGSKSFDPDLGSREGLTYKWRINGKDRPLDNQTLGGARGTLTFDEIGTYTVSLTVTNKYGKVASSEQNFSVKSLLAVDMKIDPEVAQIKKTVHFVAHSQNAEFYEWNFGDGSDPLNGDADKVDHIYKKTGVYTVKLTVRRAQGDESNTITRRVYITDTDSPFALITARNSSNSIVEMPGLCKNQNAFTVNRSEPTTFDAGKSINIDGNPGDLEYTWRYMGKVNTSQSITETFGDLGCFPISLTVRSKKNGATATTEKYMYLKNQLPQLTSITTQVDERKKDSRKIIVNVKANGVKDPDGVVTAYTWYYKTETDPEPQSLQITQKPEITFVLPNITEKYYFGVILQDNDNGRVNSEKTLQKQAPLIIDNANGNVYLPLISLNPSKTTAKVNENIRFSASASTILATNITNKSQYAWDFDGDGHIDKTTQEPYVDYAYKRVGTFNMKVRVTYNGVSNVKYQTINIRNPLKASFQAYKLDNSLYLINTSQGAFDKVYWKFGDFSNDALYNTLIPFEKIPLADKDGFIGELSISYNDTEVDTVKIYMKDIEQIVPDDSGVYQSSIPVENDTIHITSPSQGLGLSFYGNDKNITRFGIDTDVNTDSNLDGNAENDIDNKDHSSFKNGSFFRIPNFANDTKRERKIKISFFEGERVVKTKTLTLILDFISATPEKDIEMEKFGANALSNFEKEKIDTLATLIREIEDATERIIIMKKYNILVENWNDSFEKAKTLIDIQELIVDAELPAQKKKQITKIIDELLIGGAESVNSITVAAQLIKDLVPIDNANREKIIGNLDTILNQIDKKEENRKLAKEILELIKNDDTIATKYKEYIKSQLQIIIHKGSKNIPKSTNPAKKTLKNGKDGISKTASGVGGFFMGIIKIFLWIFLIIFLIILGAYIFYRVTRKNSKLAFQDFMIDSVFHGGKAKKEAQEQKVATSSPEKKKSPEKISTPTNTQPVNDPLAPKTTPTQTQKTTLPTQEQKDPLTSFEVPKKETTPNPSENTNPINQPASTTDNMPDWLKSPSTSNAPKVTVTDDPLSSLTTKETNAPDNKPKETTPVVGNDVTTEKTNQNTLSPETKSTPDAISDDVPLITNDKIEKEIKTENTTQITEETTSDEGLPDWLKGPVTSTNDEPKNDINEEIESEKNVNETISTNTSLSENNETPEEIISETIKTAENTTEIETTETNEYKDSTAQETADEGLPDWLVDSDENETSDDDTLPDWLVDEISDTETSTENKDDTEIKTITEEEKIQKTETKKEKKKPTNNIIIEDTGSLEAPIETNLIDTPVTEHEAIKIEEDDSILKIVEEKAEEKKEKEIPKKSRTRKPRRKKKQNTTSQKNAKTQTKTTTHKKTTKTTTNTVKNTNQTDIPDWLK